MRSLQTRLLITVGTLALLAVAAVALLARQSTRRELRRLEAIERQASQAARPVITRRVVGILDGRCCVDAVLNEAQSALGANMGALVTDPVDGRLIAAAGERFSRASLLRTSHDGTDLQIDMRVDVDDGRSEHAVLRVTAGGTPLELADGTSARLYVLPMPDVGRQREVAAVLRAVDRRLVWGTALVGVVALAVTWLIARSSVRPLRALQAATREIAGGRLETRVPPAGSREIAALTADFNAMAGDLQRQHQVRQQLLHDVAHELRTPLTALRCRLETVIDGLARDPARAVRDLREDVRHLSALVDDLQDVSLAEARALVIEPALHEATDLVDRALRAVGLEADRRVRVDVPPATCVRGDRRRLLQILTNLLSNADRHTPSSGTITIQVRPVSGAVAVTVANTGSHLSPDQAARVFDRFYRTDPSRQRATGGTGLGLAIVKHLAEAHGGHATVASTPDGVSFTVVLPDGTGTTRVLFPFPFLLSFCLLPFPFCLFPSYF